MIQRLTFAALCIASLYASWHVTLYFCAFTVDIMLTTNNWTLLGKIGLAALAFGPGIVSAITLVCVSHIIIWGSDE